MRHLPRYRRRLLALILGASFAGTGWTQDTDTANDENPASETQAEEPATPALSTENSSPEELSTQEIDVDDGSYLDADEEDFRPSEEVPADESIPFPTDI